MQTSVDGREDRRSRHRLRWLAALVVLAAVAVAVVIRTIGGDGAGAGGEPPPSPELPEQLSTRVVTILEQSSAAEHAEHGHRFDEEAQRVLCAAKAFGFEPADATTVDQVRVVYAHHMCAEVGPGLGWPDAIRAAGPLAVEFTEPVTVRTPELVPSAEDMAYADRIRALIPERYHEQALAGSGFVDPAVADALRQRYETAAG